MAMRTVAAALALSLAATPSALRAQERIITTEAGRVRVTTFVSGLVHPWGVEVLPNGRLIVTERPGRLRLVSTAGVVSAPLAGVPAVSAQGQGGLLDVALDPSFLSTRRVYVCYAEPGAGGTASTAVARGRLTSGALETVQVIYRQQPKVTGGAHFGCRLAFARDGRLFVTLGERFTFDPAQDLGVTLGKVARINLDGSIPADNPFVGVAGARPSIWSYGHRNPQGAAINPRTGALWTAELGPLGGDEVNITLAGRNYGWPLVSWGNNYDGTDIPDPPTRPDLARPIYYWNPSISPSGISFYTGGAFPAWRGNLFLAALGTQGIVRLGLDGNRVTGEERIGLGARIRDVRPDPAGRLYLLTDEDAGEVLRLTPVGNW